MSPRTLLLCCLALIGFAANSLLSRLALRPHLIDPATFTAIRLGTGAAALLLLSHLRGKRTLDARQHGNWTSAWLLLGYAVPFTWAYQRIGAGIGALIMFGTVQITMIGWGIAQGERPGMREWFGLSLALLGLGLLTLPGATRPDLGGLGLMIVAGVGWGAYSLRGRGSRDPLAATTRNFVLSAPLAAVTWLAARLIGGPQAWHVERDGAAFAAASGALASGLGYTLWYAALPGMSAMRAALVQLSVPILAAGAAVVLLDEPLSLRLVFASVMVLAGVLIAMRKRAPGARTQLATRPRVTTYDPARTHPRGRRTQGGDMAHNSKWLGGSIVIALAYAGCGGGQTKQENAAPVGSNGGETNAMTTEETLRANNAGSAKEPRAQAKLEDAPGVALQGDAKFEAEPDGVRVTVSVKDATPGEHGIHVHQLGDCSDIPGKSMGEHLQPEGNPHGLPDQPAHHLGDMGNIDVGADGKGNLDFVIKDATLDNGRNGLLGKALVIHEKEDIGTGKSGESGTPIACGVIESKP